MRKNFKSVAAITLMKKGLKVKPVDWPDSMYFHIFDDTIYNEKNEILPKMYSFKKLLFEVSPLSKSYNKKELSTVPISWTMKIKTAAKIRKLAKQKGLCPGAFLDYVVENML